MIKNNILEDISLVFMYGIFQMYFQMAIDLYFLSIDRIKGLRLYTIFRLRGNF